MIYAVEVEKVRISEKNRDKVRIAPFPLIYAVEVEKVRISEKNRDKVRIAPFPRGFFSPTDHASLTCAAPRDLRMPTAIRPRKRTNNQILEKIKMGQERPCKPFCAVY